MTAPSRGRVPLTGRPPGGPGAAPQRDRTDGCVVAERTQRGETHRPRQSLHAEGLHPHRRHRAVSALVAAAVATAWRGARRAAAARPPVSRAGRAHARVLVRTTALPRRGDQGGRARDRAARAGGAPACSPGPTRRATSPARRLYEAHHRRFTHVHRLSAPVPLSVAGSPP